MSLIVPDESGQRPFHQATLRKNALCDDNEFQRQMIIMVGTAERKMREIKKILPAYINFTWRSVREDRKIYFFIDTNGWG